MAVPQNSAAGDSPRATCVLCPQGIHDGTPANGAAGVPSYRFTSRSDRPLSITVAERVTEVLTNQVGERTHKHDLRHKWADDIARGCVEPASLARWHPPRMLSHRKHR